LDEPTSALDPTSVQNVKDLIEEPKHDVTAAIVTDNFSKPCAARSRRVLLPWIDSRGWFGKADVRVAAIKI
jgi:ABC-type phosphate transport system ATPase subunit